MENISSLRIGNILNVKNEIIGTVDRMKFKDNNRIYYDINTRSLGRGFESIEELNSWLNKYNYRMV